MSRGQIPMSCPQVVKGALGITRESYTGRQNECNENSCNSVCHVFFGPVHCHNHILHPPVKWLPGGKTQSSLVGRCVLLKASNDFLLWKPSVKAQVLGLSSCSQDPEQGLIIPGACSKDGKWFNFHEVSWGIVMPFSSHFLYLYK